MSDAERMCDFCWRQAANFCIAVGVGAAVMHWPITAVFFVFWGLLGRDTFAS